MDRDDNMLPPLLNSNGGIFGIINSMIIPTNIPSSNLPSSNTESTSEEFINNLDEFTLDEEILKKNLQCSICLDDFEKGDKCIKLPCKEDPHYFHSGCDKCSGIREWLKRKNTCPMCRTEFPMENTTDRPLSGSGRTRSIFETLTLHTMVIPSSNNDSLNSEEINIPNPNNLENTISDLITNYLNDIGQNDEQRDVQLAIQASLNDT